MLVGEYWPAFKLQATAIRIRTDLNIHANTWLGMHARYINLPRCLNCFCCSNKEIKINHLSSWSFGAKLLTNWQERCLLGIHVLFLSIQNTFALAIIVNNLLCLYGNWIKFCAHTIRSARLSVISDTLNCTIHGIETQRFRYINNSQIVMNENGLATGSIPIKFWSSKVWV